MKIKNTILAGLLLAALPMAVQAQEVENYDEYQVSCETGAECNDFEVNYGEQPTTDDELSQRTRTRRTRRSSSDFKKIYVGGSLGLAELFFDNTDIGFGGSILAGYRVDKNISAELEIFDYFGGTDTDDLGYNYLGFAANGSYRIPFGEKSNSIYAFVSPGIGFGRLGLTGDVADDRDDLDLDNSASGFLLQAKAGVGYPVSESISLFGQARYAHVFLGDTEVTTEDGDDANGITFDIGATFGF